MHLPANTFSAQHESCGADTSASRGTVPVAGTSNAKGAWSQLIAATSFVYEGITIYAFSNTGAADFLIDIGIGSAGNEFVVVESLHYAAFKTTEEHNLQMDVPVHIPSGVRLSVRISASTNSIDCDIVVVGHSANPGGYPGYSRAVALFTAASSRGVAIDPGGAPANTNGAWSQLVASTAVDVAAIFGVIGFNADVGRATAASFNLGIGIGAAASEQVVVEGLCLSWGATWDGPVDVFFQPIACAIPLGSRIAARGRSNITAAGDRTIDLALYGLVP